MPRRFVPFDINICGVSELPLFARKGVSHVVSILDPHTPVPGHFDDFEAHRRIDFRFHDIIEDWEGHQAPAAADVENLIALGRALHEDGASHVLVHCFAGVSRSTAAAIILMVRENPGHEDEIMNTIRRIRPRAWPNSLMIRHADQILGLGGRLVDVTRAHYRDFGARNPEFVEFLRSVGRNAEIED